MRIAPTRETLSTVVGKQQLENMKQLKDLGCIITKGVVCFKVKTGSAMSKATFTKEMILPNSKFDLKL